MKLKGKIVALSTNEVPAGIHVVLELDTGDSLEMTLKREAFEQYREKIQVGEVFTMRTNGGPAAMVWGRLPHVPG